MVSLLLGLFLLHLGNAVDLGTATFKVDFNDPRPQSPGPPVNDDLMYQVIHTIKGSYTAIGPLQVGAFLLKRVFRRVAWMHMPRQPNFEAPLW